MKKVSFFCCFVSLFFLFSVTSCTARQRRNIKTTVSDYTGGLKRRATLYSNTGDIIAVYEGKIDITSSSDNGAVFFDLDGKRIWIKGGILVVEEL